MRVNTPARLRGEGGVSAIIAAISLFGILSALMLSLDAGNLWQARRGIITATDAGALEQARTAAIFGPAAACANYEASLRRNAGSDAQSAGCSVVTGPTARTGYVTVQARKPVNVRFGGIYGQGDTTAFSATTARWGFITSIEGLRPIALCIQNEHVRGYLGTGTDLGIHPSPNIHRVMFTKDNPLLCGAGTPGNWGFVDFDGGANSNVDLRTWLTDGWSGTVAIGDCDATGSAGTPCDGDTGSGGTSIAPALNTLVASGQSFPVILFNSVVGSGANADYSVYAFLGVILRGFRVTGPEAGRYFDFEFTRITRTGNCCFATGLDTGVRGVRICSIDHDTRPTVTRCL